MKTLGIRILVSLSAIATAGAILVACGDDGGSSSGPTKPRHLASIDDAGACNAKNDEETVLVGEEKEPWWCDASTGTWTRLGGDDGDSSEEGSSGSLSSDDDESSSSGKSGGGKSSKKSSSSSSSSSSSYKEVFFDCSGKTYSAGDHTISVTVDTTRRTFIMHVPSAYKGNKAVPLVIDYHPTGGSGQSQMRDTRYKSKTDPEGVITLYPDGTAKPGGMGPGWNVGPCCSNDDDTTFTRKMIEYVKEKACIDTTRIYATGYHIGGGMALQVACSMADVFAAVSSGAMDLN